MVCDIWESASWQELTDCFRGSLSPEEKTDFISAVKCLAEKEPLTPAELAPGVRNRFDDFLATHINQTLSIHATVHLNIICLLNYR